MGNLKTVIGFTMKDMMKRRSFIVSTLIIMLFIVIGFNIPNIISSFNGGDAAEGSKFLIVDENNLFEGTLDALNQMELGYDFEIKNESITFEDIKSKMENEEIETAMIIEQPEEQIKIRYIVKNTNMMAGVPESMMSTFNTIYSNLQISKLGLTESELASLTPNFDYVLEQTEETEVKGNTLFMMMLSLVLFFAIYYSAYNVSSSITTEKTSKIMETLVTSTTPRTIIIGKTIGIGLVGLIQMGSIVIVAILSAMAFLDAEMIKSVLDVSQITPGLGLLTLVYFILGYFAYALLYALTGSTVSKPEDIQSANGPIAMITLVGFYLAYFTMMNPTSDLNFIAGILTISSPFCMPLRAMMGIASAGEIALSIGILIVTILVIAQVAIKIYSSAIFNYGTRMTFKDIVKVYRDKNN